MAQNEDLTIEECAEMLLNLSAAVADLQVDEESRQAIFYCLNRVADHFGIPVNEVLEEYGPEQPGITIKVTEHKGQPPGDTTGPVFRVIDGDKNDDD